MWHYGSMERQKQSKTTMRLDPELHKRLRILAIERGTTFGALVNEVLRKFLEREEKRVRKGKE